MIPETARSINEMNDVQAFKCTDNMAAGEHARARLLKLKA